MKISLRKKIYGLAAIAALLPMLVVLLLMLRFRTTATQDAARHMTDLAFANVEQTAKDIYGLCETTNDLLERRVGQNLTVARRLLAQRGGAAVGGGPVAWQAVNQSSGQSTAVTLPQMTIGGAGATPDHSLQAAGTVDEISRYTGGAASIFQRMNDQGDMLRVSTTLPSAGGGRAVGTYIPAIGPDGAPSPQVATVLRGEVYRGSSFVVNDWYVAAYEPLRDGTGKVIGVLSVGRTPGIGRSSPAHDREHDDRQERTHHRDRLQRHAPGPLYHLQGQPARRRGYLGNPGRLGQLPGAAPRAEGALPCPAERFSAPRTCGRTRASPHRGMKRAAFIYFQPWDWLINASAPTTTSTSPQWTRWGPR